MAFLEFIMFVAAGFFAPFSLCWIAEKAGYECNLNFAFSITLLGILAAHIVGGH